MEVPGPDGVQLLHSGLEGEKHTFVTFGAETRMKYARRCAMYLARPLPLAKNETNRALLIGTSCLAKLETLS